MQDSSRPLGISTISSALPDAVNYHAWLLDLISPKIGREMLEIGPGYGQYTGFFFNRTGRLAVADIAQDCIEHLQRKFPDVEAVMADLEAPDWTSQVTRQGLFDTIVALNVLEHIQDDQAALRNIWSALRPEARLLLLVPAHQALYGQMDRLAGHWRRYSRRNLCNLLQRAGFSVDTCVHINPVGGLGWLANTLLYRPKSLSAATVNTQILFFDKWLLPVSRFLSPLTAIFFGQSLWCIATKNAQNSKTGNTQQERTVQDFGDQWSAYRENTGCYASINTLRDICGPFFDIGNFKGKRVADIGSGTGRIVNMLLEAGASFVTAVEPSAAFAVLRENTLAHNSRIQYLQMTGEDLPPGDYDYIVSFGVIHHIPEPLNTMRAAFAALRFGGTMVVWLYGREGNRIYLAFAKPLRLITSKLPHRFLHTFAKLLAVFLDGYIFLCRYFPLPMRRYMNNVLAKWDSQTKFVTIYDQLNPTYAKYYKREEVYNLFSEAGFVNITLHHRHGYSWTATGEKPAQAALK